MRQFVMLSAVVLVAAAGLARAEEPRLGELYRQLFQERQHNLDRLRAYGERGQFPLNEHFPVKTPYFVDGHGTTCAMAQLLRDSGRNDIVEQVVRLNNQIEVMDVKDGPFLDWIVRSGLTQAECARIQPKYSPKYSPPQPPVVPSPVPPPVQQPEPPRVVIAVSGEEQQLRKHFIDVEAELRANTLPSLDRAMQVLRDREKKPFEGKCFSVIAPPAEKLGKSTLTLKNLSRARQMEVQLTFFDAQGNLVKQDIPKFAARGTCHSAMLPPGQELEVPYACDDTWLVIEWTEGPGLNVTVPFATVADAK